MYYYKSSNCLVCLKEPYEELPDGYQEITEQEYNQLSQERMPPSYRINPTISRINQLKSLLQQSDYQAIKYAEGWLTEQEYAPIKAQRQAYRDEINQLEQELENEQ